MYIKLPLPAALLLFVMLVSGCAFDRRKEVAYDLLYRPDGMENDAAFNAAAKARFPSGTTLEELQTFFGRSHGGCKAQEQDRVVCEAPIRTGLCWARLMKIDATVHEGKVNSVSVLVGRIGC